MKTFDEALDMLSDKHTSHEVITAQVEQLKPTIAEIMSNSRFHDFVDSAIDYICDEMKVCDAKEFYIHAFVDGLKIGMEMEKS